MSNFTSDEILVEALKKGDNNALKFIYRTYWPMISKFVRSNSGSLEDAEELYQEGIIALYENVRNADFMLRCSVKTYIYSICRNKWLFLLKGRKKTIVDMEAFDRLDVEPEGNECELPEDKEIKDRIISMGEPCHSLLIGFYYHQLPMDLLAVQLNYNSANVAKQQKFRCVERLKKIFSQKELKYAHG